jgi:hypothetical protein
VTARDDKPLLPRLADQFDAAAVRAARDELERERRRRRFSPHRGLVAVVVAVLVGGGVGGVAVAVDAIIGDGGSQGSGVRPPRDTAPAPAGQQPMVARAEDPSGAAAPKWGLTNYPQKGGGTCAVMGQIVGDRVGTLIGGQFIKNEPDVQGACARLPAVHVLATARADPHVPGGRTALYGIVDTTVTAIELIDPDGHSRPIDWASDGSFILVRRGCQAFRGYHLRVVADGRILRPPLQLISQPCP